MIGLAKTESKPTPLYTGRFQDKHSISVEIDPPYSQHFQYEALLQKTIANLKIEAHTLNQGSYKKFIQNHFFKNEVDTAQNNKKKLHSIFSEIENLLYDSDISIENKIKNLESIAADIRTSILEIHIEKRSDQGKHRGCAHSIYHDEYKFMESTHRFKNYQYSSFFTYLHTLFHQLSPSFFTYGRIYLYSIL